MMLKEYWYVYASFACVAIGFVVLVISSPMRITPGEFYRRTFGEAPKPPVRDPSFERWLRKWIGHA